MYPLCRKRQRRRRMWRGRSAMGRRSKHRGFWHRLGGKMRGEGQCREKLESPFCFVNGKK